MRRPGTAILALTSALLAAPPASGIAATMGLQDVLGRHASARGGEERWRSLQSIEISGSQTCFSVPSPFRIVRARPNLYRMEQTILKRPVVEVYDGEHAWWINGLMGNTWPLPAPRSFAAVIAREAVFDTPLLGYPANGHRLELKGPVDFEGKRVWAIEVARADGAPETWYLDTKSFLEVARISRTVDFGQEMEKRSYYSDFRPEDGLVLPHRIEMEYGTRAETLVVERVRAGFTPEKGLFEMPPPEGMGPLASLVGDWALKIETRPGPRAPWVAVETTSAIVKLLDGGLLEERFSRVEDGLPAAVVRTWSYDQFGKVYRITQIDNYSFHQNVLEGTMTDGRLTASNEKSGTIVRTPDTSAHHRLVAYEMGPDGFKVDWESSADEGKTWSTEIKYTYSRRTNSP